MKLWKQFSIQKQDTIDYFNTRKDFRPDVFAARLNQLILEVLDAKEKVGVMFLAINDFTCGHLSLPPTQS